MIRLVIARSILFGLGFIGVLMALLHSLSASGPSWPLGITITIASIAGWLVCDWVEHTR